MGAWSVASVMSDSLWPHGLQPARLLCLWDSPGENTGVGCHALLQEIFPPSDQTHVSCGSWTAGRFFTAEPLGVYAVNISLSFHLSCNFFLMAYSIIISPCFILRNCPPHTNTSRFHEANSPTVCVSNHYALQPSTEGTDLAIASTLLLWESPRPSIPGVPDPGGETPM